MLKIFADKDINQYKFLGIFVALKKAMLNFVLDFIEQTIR